MRRRFGQRGTGRRGAVYGSVLGLVLAAAGIGALVVFLLRRNRGDVREEVERASETVRSRAEEYAGTSGGESESRGAAEETPTGEERGATEGRTEERRRTVREFADKLEETSADRTEQQAADREDEGASGDTGGELRGIVRESMRRSEETSGGRGEAGSQETEEEAGSTGEREGAAGGQVTVVGLLAKMGEAFEETGGGRFILSSEEEGNFDLHGKEEELDEIYQQQIQAKVTGRITDEDTQPRIMEVDEVQPA